MERYKKLKNRRTSLKASTTRQLSQLDACLNEQPPNKIVFENKRLLLQSNLTCLREVLKSMSEALVDLTFDSKTAYEDALKDIDENELALENKENAAAKLKQTFDTIDFNSKPSRSVEETMSVNSQSKPKFKPKDLSIPKWDGNAINFKAWKSRITDYFELTGLDSDNEQLAILLYEPTLPLKIQSTLHDCVSLESVWERLNLKFPADFIPRAILKDLKETKPMSSNSAHEMRRVLEKIKTYARHSKEANTDSDLKCHVTLDLIEQKLTDHLVRNFRRWMHREHNKVSANVDYLINFLQNETELEENLFNRSSSTQHVKPNRSSVNQLNAEIANTCPLCSKAKHRFVDCEKFKISTPQQRTDAMKRLGRCYTCLGPIHRNPTHCRFRRRCSSCQRSHHTMLACVSANNISSSATNSDTINNASRSLNASAPSFTPSIPNVDSTNFEKHLNEPKYRYSPATFVELLDCDGKWHKAVALFDSGSDVTLVKSEIVAKLKLDRKPKKFTFGTAGGDYKTENSAVVSLWVRRYDKKTYRFNISAIELNKPAHDIPGLGESFFEEHSYLESLKNWIPRESMAVDILFGFDQANLIAPSSYLSHPDMSDTQPRAAETKLGWYIFGPSATAVDQAGIRTNVHLIRTEVPDIRSWYEADICGVKPSSICACEENEIKESQFLKHVRKTINQTDDGRIEVSLPWKDGFPSCLQFNRHYALVMLNSLEHRLKKQNLLETYDHEMNLIISECAEPVPTTEIEKKLGWYLNHFPVLRPGKSTSCRIVWNSAAIYEGLALNDGLHKGPDLLNNLFTILCIWRQNPTALVGDIKKMFNQVQIAVQDRAYHRFLWRKGDQSQQPKDYQWKRLLFGDKPAPDLSISALHFLADQYSDVYPTASNIIKHDCYMDDIAFSVSASQDVISLKKELNTILSSGKFAVKGWHSNDVKVDEFAEETVTEVLGLRWNKRLDVIQIKIPTFQMPTVVTKRAILSSVAKLWDPIGILAPITLRLRILLQSLWSNNLTWDDPVDSQTIAEFQNQMRDVDHLRTFWIDRCIEPALSNSIELHEFCDGGEKGYGAVVWLRIFSTEGLKLKFIAAKSYVTSLKKRSIPRIELMSAVILTRLIANIRKELPCCQVYMWTDSAVLLHWLKMSANRFKPFVSARVQEIRDTLDNDISCFRYVKSKLNPADALTKPIAVSKLADWHKGPKFLKNSDTILNMTPDTPNNIVEISQREEKKIANAHHVNINSFENVLLNRVCSWSKLLRVVAWLRRPLIEYANRCADLTVVELDNSKNCLFWIAQGELREPLRNRTREKLNLQTVEDNTNLLRIHGRLANFSYNELATRPIALPSGSRIVKLFAEHMHQSLGHQGYRVIIVNLFAQGIHILRGKKLLKSIAANCVKCRINRRELLQQQMGQLPTFRFKAYSPPYSSVALDYFGPVKIRKTRNVVIEGAILLITSTTTRVVHLELAEIQSTDDFLLAWRRFVSKRGVHPVSVFSDQAKSFVAAEKTLRIWVSSWDKSTINDFMTKRGTTFTWQFNTPKASHMNGVVESLVRSCRKALDATTSYHKRSYSNNEWETIVAEVNYLVNSRPLFPKSVEDLDEEPYTGNTLLHPYGERTVPQNLTCESVDPRKSIKIAQSFLKSYWDAWMRNMPPQLLLRNKWFKTRQNLSVGDYVIVLEPGLHGKFAPRGLWEHAIIHKILPGSDGLVRKVELRLSGQRKLTRPIHKLCLIATAEELASSEAVE